MPLRSVPDLLGALHERAGGKPAVLQIERMGQFIYIEREVDRQSPVSVSDRTDRH
jgi:hypothetical protein